MKSFSADDIRSGHQTHRLASLVHRYFALIEDRDASSDQLRELFADDFHLKFTMVTITSHDELAAWVAEMHETFQAYTLVVLDMRVDRTNGVRLELDLELHGIHASGEVVYLETTHDWQIELTPDRPLDRIRAISVEHRTS